MEKFFRHLSMLIVMAFVLAGTHAFAGQPYSFQMQLAVDGRVVSTPAAVVAVGAPGEIEVTSKDGNAYRFQINPKHAVTKAGNTTVMVQLRLLEKESSKDAWSLIASPEMMGNPTADEPMTLHMAHTTANGVPLQLDVRVVPGDRLESSASRTALARFGGVHPNMIKTCEDCDSGDTLCCTNACCSDSANGCDEVCDP